MNSILKRTTSNTNPWRFNLDSFLDSGWPKLDTSFPAVNVAENDNGFTVELVAPGFNKEDFKLKVDDDILSVTAETKQEKNENGKNNEYTRREYSYSSFTRSFRLPENVKDDAINAVYNNGILKVELPKIEQQTKASKEISIQ